MVYQWKAGARITGDAQAIGDRLEALRMAHGGALTPAAVVNDARPPESPMHACFEWDDAAAAAEYRLEQARAVIRAVVVAHLPDHDGGPVRAFVHVPAPAPDTPAGAEPAYTSIGAALASPVLRAIVVHQAKGELAAWARRYRELKELASLFGPISDVVGPDLFDPPAADGE